LLVPDAAHEIAGAVHDAAIEREDEAERQLGDRDRVLAGAVGDVDAALRGGLDVDRVVAGAGADDEREVAGLEHRPGDLGRPHDERFGAGLADRVAQRVVAVVRPVDDVEARGGEAFEPALLELVGDENSHVRSRGSRARRAAWARTRWTWAA